MKVLQFAFLILWETATLTLGPFAVADSVDIDTLVLSKNSPTDSLAADNTSSLPLLSSNDTSTPFPLPPEFNLTTASSRSFVENCGTRTNHILGLLFALSESPLEARRDAAAYDINGTDSPAFKALFKERAVASTVSLLMQHMASLTGMLGLRPKPERTLRPRFACVDPFFLDRKWEKLNLGYDPWRRCHDGRAEKRPRSFYAEGTAYIFLCPAFFLLLPRPAESECPEVRGNTFRGGQSLLVGGQVYEMVYDLARFYLGRNALDSWSNPQERLDWNQCVFDLNDLESVVNPRSLQLYVACESSSRRARDDRRVANDVWSTVVENEGCEEYPNPDVPYDAAQYNQTFNLLGSESAAVDNS